MRQRTGRLLTAAFAGVAVSALLTAPAYAVDGSSVTGTVTDHMTGAAVPGACVTAFRATDDAEQGSACADATGAYTVTGLPEGEYHIRVTATGYAQWWAYDAPDVTAAAALWLSSTGPTRLDVSLWQGAGSVAGQITDETGAPATATVTVERADDQWWSRTTSTGTDGRYTVDGVPPGPYRVSFSDSVHSTQWAYGKDLFGSADIITVTDGATTTVNDKFLPLATVVVTVTDAVTGAPVPDACAQVWSGQQPRACGGADGVVTVTGVQATQTSLSVWDANGAHFGDDSLWLDVTHAGPNTLTVALQPAASIVMTVREAGTGKPVSACAHLVGQQEHGLSAHGTQYCGDPQTGRLVIGPAAPDTVRVFLTPADDVHGAMWVGDGVGTGDQREARQITMRPGVAVTLPPVSMGLAGTISGVITNAATGAPTGGVCAYPYAFNAGQGMDVGPACADGTGHYTITGLGPYRWPVEFASYTDSYAWQWSGGAADRFAAQMVRVTSGETATLDAAMVAGGTLPGTVTDRSGQPTFGYIFVYNAVTGDPATGYIATEFTPAGSFTAGGLATQNVQVEYYVSGAGRCWYQDKSSLASADRIKITAGVAAPPITLVDCNG